MLYGLTNAPVFFQSFINETLGDMFRHYDIDDMIYSASYDNHVRHVWTVLARLFQHRLSVKAKKCEFHRDTISFLGYVISQRGVEMDTSKVFRIYGFPEDIVSDRGTQSNGQTKQLNQEIGRYLSYCSINGPAHSCRGEARSSNEPPLPHEIDGYLAHWVSIHLNSETPSTAPALPGGLDGVWSGGGVDVLEAGNMGKHKVLSEFDGGSNCDS
ncbi:hypothetical protein QTP70_028859 [Hemibagrus guttatus]|uniref:ribonuclease H n=1 Tax=Hemibagrus guttatus TaxID=175788 RepID=A0AAE0UNH0_9TELE|nr:hypothetical protein QTP70_028859 [Hemibagrus guttatus]KAK3534584.1 hypothetical protein QTP86_016728 [Hemibagrus guttatus]